MSPSPRAADAFRAGPIPAAAGIGLRPAHAAALIENPRAAAWIEVHSENYLCPGGPRLASLERLRRDLPLSCHGVGLSLGSAALPDRRHLLALRGMIGRFQPALVSEHLSWSVADGVYLNDLLPLPYTEESLALVCRNVEHAQHVLGRQLLLENPSTYLRFAASVIPECEFLAEVARSTGCAILLDVNNVHVSAFNHGFDPFAYIAAIPAAAVREIHLAGHAAQRWRDQTMLLDDHGSAVADAVWCLYEHTLRLTGPVPTLVEWDTNLPPLTTLLGEAAKARALLDAAAPRQDPEAAPPRGSADAA